MIFPIWWRGRGNLVPLVAIACVTAGMLLSVSFGPRANDLGVAGGLLAAAGINALLSRAAPGSSFYSIPMFIWSFLMASLAIWRAVEIFR